MNIKKTPKKVLKKNSPKKPVKKTVSKKPVKKVAPKKSVSVKSAPKIAAKKIEEIKDTVISIRISSRTLDRIKSKAQKKGVPYQTMIGKWISKKAK